VHIQIHGKIFVGDKIMQFALKNNYSSGKCLEISVLKRIVDFLSCNGIEKYVSQNNEMSSFNMNDLLLVPPHSPIRLSQTVIRKETMNCDSSKNFDIYNYIYTLHDELYGCHEDNFAINYIATTTALIIDRVLNQETNTSFFCYNEVERGNKKLKELEIALYDFTFPQAKMFYDKLLNYVLRKSIDFVTVPTFFSWADAAVAFRSSDRKIKYGAMGFIKKEITCLRKINIGDAPICIIGLPLKTLFKKGE